MLKFKSGVIASIAIAISTASFTHNVYARDGFGAEPKHGHARHGMTETPNILFRLDIDGDELVSLDEFITARTKRSAQRFNVIDQDNDTVITQDEYESTIMHKPGGRHRGFEPDVTMLEECLKQQLGDAYKERPSWEDVLAYDASGDSLIDSDEFLAYQEASVSARFGEIDTNDDTVLEASELEAIQSQIQARHEAHMGCTMEQKELNNVLAF